MTVAVVLLRHAPSDWNETGLIQGRADRRLTPEGRALAASWRVPEAFAGWRWATSPLARARETAALLGHADATVDDRLAEMDWGDWSGRTLADLRAEHGRAMAENEARGLDFRPAGGESPREVAARLADWLAAVASAGRPTVAVTHRGVQRAALALAAGWDFRGRPPLRLAREALLVLEVAGDRVALGAPPLVPLEPAA